MSNDTRPLFNICSIPECGRALQPPYGRGWCSKHYGKWQKYGDPLADHTRPKVQGVAPCSVDGCEKVSHSLDLCSTHYSRRLRNGSEFIESLMAIERTCQHCGCTYVATGKQRRACSPECKVEYDKARARRIANERRAANPAPPIVTHYATCVYCGEAFGANKRRYKYCSRACVTGDKKRSYYAERRATEKRVAYESFRNIEIFKRDNWICGICKEPIDPKIAWPDPRSVSLDHIHPISLGGGHLRGNVQAAHLRCNCQKKNSVP